MLIRTNLLNSYINIFILKFLSINYGDNQFIEYEIK